MIKPVNQYQTRLGRRIAVAACIPVVVLAVPFVALLGAGEALQEVYRSVFSAIRYAWTK